MYPTGSTFKPIVAEAALSEGLITPSTPQLCTGTLHDRRHTFHNVEAGVYESMSLPTALAQSCDTWFYRLGDKFFLKGSQGIQHWAKLLGLGHPTGFDVPGESPGLVPTPAWLQKYQHMPWYEGQTINLSIGQGYLQVTPLQLAVAYSALVNGGTVVRPHVGKAILRGESVQTLKFKPVRKVKLTDVWAIKQGPLRSRALGGRHLDVGLRELSRGDRRQDGHGGVGSRQERPFVVCIVGAGRPPEGRRRRPDRARRFRCGGRGAGGEGDLPGVLQAEAVAGACGRCTKRISRLRFEPMDYRHHTTVERGSGIVRP